MRKLLLGATALAALVAAYPAGAADLPTSTYKAPAAPAAAPTSSWTGFYAGLGLGFRASRTDATTTSATDFGGPVDLTGVATSQPLDGTGFHAAPYAGLNWQIAPQWVVGIEGDVGFANQTTAFTGFTFSPVFDSLEVKTTWDASARGRIGFLLTPATLVYATGGVAWQHYDVTSTCVSGMILCKSIGFAHVVTTNSVNKAGWTVGGGIETALWGNWFARADYRYADFGTSSFNLTGPGVVDNFNVALHTHTATFGLAYKFGDPVAAGNPAGAFPVKAPPAVVSWSGLYAGLGLGLRASRTDATTTSLTLGSLPIDLTGFATSEPFDGTGFHAAPYAGLNWQVAPQWVVGIEGDVGFANQTTARGGFPFSPSVFSGSQSADSLAVKTTWDASARGRIGFLLTPATLVYATGGVAWQHYDVTSTCADANFCGPGLGFGFTPAVISNSATKLGWTVGGGIETALWGNWFARADYRYADFGTSSFNLTRAATFPPFNPTVDNFNVALRTHTATFGLAYKFDWGSTVVAKY